METPSDIIHKLLENKHKTILFSGACIIFNGFYYFLLYDLNGGTLLDVGSLFPIYLSYNIHAKSASFFRRSTF